MLQLSKTELEMIQVACNAAALVSSVNWLAAQEREFLDIAAHCKELSEADAPCQITWVAEDIQTLRPNWTLEQCDDWLGSNSTHIEDRSTELGWEVIDSLLESEELTEAK